MSDDIYLRNLDHDYYLTIDKAMAYTIQKYQQELDSQLGLFQNRKNANEELNVWGLHGEDGPLVYMFHIKNFKSIYMLTKD